MSLLRCVFGTLILGSVLLVSAPAQQPDAVLSGTVVDPSGARITYAQIHIHGSGLDRDLASNGVGSFSLLLPAGSYSISASAPEFRTYSREDLSLRPGEHRDVSIRLLIATQAEEISVDPSGGINPADNRNSLSFSGGQLDVLSSDPDTLRQQLIAMAGGGAGIMSPQIYVDGFSNGQLPPKAAIRSIRINSNPYSTVHDRLGFGRIEVETQAGGNKFHGDLDLGGTDVALNSRNPYTTAQPPYHQLLFRGDLSGPIAKKTSFFLAGSSNDLQNNTVVNAFDPTSLAAVSEAVPNPQRTDLYSFRVDHQFSAANQINGRYAFSRTHLMNGGVGQLVLPSAGFTSETISHTVDLADNAILSPKIVNDARIQYMRTELRQDPNDTSASIVVQGSFNGGGSPAQAVHDNQTQVEVQENLSIDHGRHYIRAGLRYRRYLDSNFSNSGFNGQYIYPDLTDYPYVPTQFSITAGQPNTAVSTADASIYAEDDWKLASNFTLSYGLRFETQTAIPDHIDPAPRVGFAWAIRPKGARVPVLTLRAGAGLFYDRFAIANLLQATRQNGTNQTTYVFQNPGSDCVMTSSGCAAPAATVPTAAQPTVYQVDPDLRSSYSLVTSVTAERAIGRIGAITLNYLHAHGDHLYLSRNINAPLPGTFDPTNPGTAVRPLGATQNIYQFTSEGEANSHIIFSNFNLQPTRKLMLFAFYVSEHTDADANGAASFASNSYNIRQDYGPEDANATQQIFVGGSWTLPWGLSVDPFISARSGRPFNIVTGTDLNGDTIYNDRPAFATDLSRPSVVHTALGNFDTDPLPSQKLVPYNYGRAPGLFWVDLQAKETLHIGPRSHVPAAARAQGAPPKAAAKPERPWALSFSVEAQNLFNHVNPGLPVGIVTSPFFGRPLSLANDFSSLSAANRSFLLHTTFTF